MANFTTNYNLRKPIDDEFFDIEHANGNMDIIDGALKNIADAADAGIAGNASDIASGDAALQTQINALSFNQLILENETMDTGLSLGGCVSNDGTKWVKTATPEGLYLGNNVVATSGLVNLSGFSLDSGYTYFAQADGAIGLGVTAYPVGKAVSVNQLILDFNPPITYPKAYNGEMIQFYATPGSNGKVRLKVVNAGLSDGVMIRKKSSAWSAGDTKTTGTLVADITDDSGYSGNNGWFYDSGLAFGTTYYYKAFPYKGSVYNETIGVNEANARAGLLLHEYSGDSVSGNTILDTAGLNNFSCSGVTFENGKVGNAATGTGSGYAAGSGISLANATITFWLNHDNVGLCGILGNTTLSPWDLFVYKDGAGLYAGTYDFGFLGVSATLTSGWNFITLKFNSTATYIELYVNGVYVTGHAVAPLYNIDDLFRCVAGRSGGSGLANLDGQVDQLRFYSMNLTQAEIEQLYKGGYGC